VKIIDFNHTHPGIVTGALLGTVAAGHRYRALLPVTGGRYVQTMYSSVTSCALVGVEPRAVQIETVVSKGRGGFKIVGLPDAAIRESKERVRSAIRESGYHFPGGSVVVNLSPADLPKVGATYDFPIALSVLAAASDNKLNFDKYVPIGELSLHGQVRPVRAALGATVVAEHEQKTCLLSSDSTVAASNNVSLAGVATLRHAVAVAQERRAPDDIGRPVEPVDDSVDLADVRDQPVARRALEIAAAGRHHLLFIGPPGAGKTMLARRLPSILPPLNSSEQRDVELVWAAAGADRPSSATPPFRAPHHSSSIAALVGGGVGLPTPGEASRAHHGVLFLDELGEFPTSVLDALRQPIEDGYVSIARQAASFRFPTAVQLIAASNPCPCGYLGDRIKGCECIESRKARYTARLSGPFLDRFDMRVVLKRLRPAALSGSRGEPSSEIRTRVVSARQRQIARGKFNSSLSGSDLDDLDTSDEAISDLISAVEEHGLSARGWDRVRRVARTITDLEGCAVVDSQHVREALRLRGSHT
jgi:magnesium chelatase family protein